MILRSLRHSEGPGCPSLADLRRSLFLRRPRPCVRIHAGPSRRTPSRSASTGLRGGPGGYPPPWADRERPAVVDLVDAPVAVEDEGIGNVDLPVGRVGGIDHFELVKQLPIRVMRRASPCRGNPSSRWCSSCRRRNINHVAVVDAELGLQLGDVAGQLPAVFGAKIAAAKISTPGKPRSRLESFPIRKAFPGSSRACYGVSPEC